MSYVALYSGPEFDIQYQYAYMITVVWLTFIFGPLMPALFIIGLVALIILYLVDRILIAYAYTKLPIYDRKTTKLTI